MVIRPKQEHFEYKTIEEKITFAQTNIQPTALKGNSCVALLTNVLPEPDWISVPCDEKLRTVVICQTQVKETMSKEQSFVISDKNIQVCKGNQLPVANTCISFQLYAEQMHSLGLNYYRKCESLYEKLIMNEHLKNMMSGYFTLIQHFYLKPIQFILPINLQNKYLTYKPFRTENFHELIWNSFVANVIQSEYKSEYKVNTLFSTSMSTIEVSSKLMQCTDGSYIDETLWCDTMRDCFDGSDEIQCICSDNSKKNKKCKYYCDEKTGHCSCSELYFTCSSFFQCIPYSKICDGHKDCLLGEDEYCTTTIKRKENNNIIYPSLMRNFICVKSNKSIPLALVNDLIPDCPISHEDELEYYNLLTSPTHSFNFSCNNNNELQCVPGHSVCFAINKLCIYEFRHNSYTVRAL